MKYTAEDALGALKTAAEMLGEPPTRKQYKNLNIKPSFKTIEKRLGGWNEALKAAGFEPNLRSYEDEQLITALSRAERMLGEVPSRSQYADLDLTPSYSAIERRFGSWNQAIKAAGLEPSHPSSKGGVGRPEYFETIDKPEKAYWFGFVYGDASVKDRRDDSSHFSDYNFAMELQKSDRYHIENFREAIKSTNKIAERERSDGEVSYLQTAQHDFIQNLIDAGCRPDKTYEFRELPFDGIELKLSFLRGYFDADGSINENKDGIRQWQVYSSDRERLSLFKSWLERHGIHGSEVYSPGSLCYSSESDLKKIYDLLYPKGEQTTPKLERKYRRFHHYLYGDSRDIPEYQKTLF